MRKKKILSIVLMLSVCLSMAGCGKTTENDTAEDIVTTESKEAESMQETEEQTEPVYTEYASYYLQEGVDQTGEGYDMNSMEPGGGDCTLTKSVDLYYVNENKCGYTKENIKIHIITSNEDYCYVNLDHQQGFLLKTKDVEEAKFVEGTEVVESKSSEGKTTENSTSAGKNQETTNSKNESASTSNSTGNSSSNTSQADQSANSEPAAGTGAEEATTAEKYTPEEAVAYYRSQVEAQGMVWDPSIKDEASRGSGCWSLSKDELNANAIANAMEGFNYGNGDGTPYRRYYLEITGSDENYVYITQWVA